MNWEVLAGSALLAFGGIFGTTILFQKKLREVSSEKKYPVYSLVFFLSGITTGALYGVWHGFAEGYSFGALMVAFAAVLFTGLGISLGLHRLFRHESFKTSQAGYVVFAVGAWMAGMRIPSWINNHRLHHANEDKEGDPHSPWTPFYGGFYGFLWSHMAWLFFWREPADGYDMSRTKPPLRMLITYEPYAFIPVLLLGLFILPYCLFGMEGVWLSCMRIVYVLHISFSINSAGHMFGAHVREKSRSRNGNWLVALFTIVGESYHANHHAKQHCAFLGWRWHDIDIGKWALIALEQLGMVWGVRRPKNV